MSRLVDTCPTHTYRATDMAFRRRGQLALTIVNHAVYTLHTTLLQYQYFETVQQLQWLLG